MRKISATSIFPVTPVSYLCFNLHFQLNTMKKQVLSLFAFAASFAAFAQGGIPNAGMETWGSSANEDQQPTSWVSYNVFTSPFIDPTNTNPTSVTQATGVDAYQGTYAAKITTIDLVTNPQSSTIPNRAGLLMTGGITITSPYLRPGYVSTNRPISMSYYTKYSPVSGDSAYCLVLISKWNSSTSSRDTIAFGIDAIGTTISAYTQRTVTLTYFDMVTIPDSAVILFSSSSFVNPQAGSALWVDALAFNGYVGIDEQTTGSPVDVYPNPSNTYTYFDVSDNDAAFVAVYDMSGREVKRADILNKKGTIDSYDLTAGMYTYSILDHNGSVLSRGKFAVSQ